MRCTSLRPFPLPTAFGVFLMALAGFAPCARAAAQQPDTSGCPTSLFQFHGIQVTSSPPSDNRTLDGGAAGYDCWAAQLWAQAGQRFFANGFGDAALRVSDRITAIGVAPGAPVTLQAQLHVSGAVAGPSSQLIAWLADGAGHLARVYRVGVPVGHEVPVDTMLHVTIHALGGVPTPIVAMLWSNCDGGWSFVNGEISYQGLPAGASVTSCRGYGGATAVPPGAAKVALAGPLPNPSRGALAFEVSLDQGPARLELFDAAGRRVGGQGLQGPARLNVTLARGALAPGLYLARLTQGPRVIDRHALLLP